MNAKEIDELLEAMAVYDFEKIIELADMEITNEDMGEFLDKNIYKMLEILVLKLINKK